MRRPRSRAFSHIAAVLYMSAEALNPKGTHRQLTSTAAAFKVLPIAVNHTTQLYLSGSLTLFALGALAVSDAAIAALVRDRGSALATIAALIGVGAFCGAIVNVLVGYNLAVCGSDGAAGGPDLAGGGATGQPRPGTRRRTRLAALIAWVPSPAHW